MNSSMGSAARDHGSARAELESLYERELATVHGFLVARCGSVHLAEDLTAEVFINAARHFGQGRGTEVTTGWLITAAKRRLVDHWRSAERERRRLGQLRLERPRHDHVADNDDDRVLRALRSLSDRQRFALTMRYLDEYSVTEIAEAMEVGYTTAESLLGRARRSFAQALKELP